jgi:hypothetical protein
MSMSLVQELACPNCGTEMEPIETTVDQLPLQGVRLCPNCYLVSWDHETGRRFQQGVPVHRDTPAPGRSRKGEC